MSRRTKDALAYALVFAIGYFMACSRTSSTNGGGSVGSFSPSARRMLNSTVRSSAIFPTNTGDQPVLASVFGFGGSARPNATTTNPNPSDLGQSFEIECTYWPPVNGNYLPGIHATFGNSGLVPMLPPRSDISIGMQDDCSAPIASVGADENGNPTGLPIFLTGTVNSLVAYGNLTSGNQFHCLDTTNTSSVQDNTFVRPYYDLAHDTIILGSGTTQLTLVCSISIPPGDDLARIQVQWIKS